MVRETKPTPVPTNNTNVVSPTPNPYGFIPGGMAPYRVGVNPIPFPVVPSFQTTSGWDMQKMSNPSSIEMNVPSGTMKTTSLLNPSAGINTNQSLHMASISIGTTPNIFDTPVGTNNSRLIL